MGYRLIQGETDGMLLTEVVCDNHEEGVVARVHTEEFGQPIEGAIYIELPQQGLLNEPHCTICNRFQLHDEEEG